MKWIKDNWPKATIFLAVYIIVILILFVRNQNYPIYLIWLQTPIYFLHQFEEYIFPGGFLEFFNIKVLKSPDGRFPLDTNASFNINVPIVFIAFPASAILATVFDISFGVWTAVFSIVNALSHIVLFVPFRYNPGFVVSLLVNIPCGIYVLYYFGVNHIVSMLDFIIGIIIGIFVQLAIMFYGFKILKPRISKIEST